MGNYGTRRWWALIALSLSLLAVGVDATVLNLALPTLATVMHASTVELQWFVDAYSLVFAAALLPAGLMGDRFGRKKLLLFALALFGLASIACAYATSAAMLIVARAALALGGAFLLPLCLSVLPVLFSDKERPTAVTVLTLTTVLAFPIGPILGGWLLTNFWWGSVFLINVPVVLLAIIAVFVLLPESRSTAKPGLDLLGIVTSSAGLVAFTYGVIQAGQNGWGDPGTLLALAVGAVLMATFVWWEQQLSRRAGQPLVDLALFRSASFTWGTILATVVSFAMFGLLFTVPQYAEAVVGTDAMGAGLRLLPLIVGLIVGGGLGNRLAHVAGAKITVALGFAVMVGGLIFGSSTSVNSGDWFMISWVAIFGGGLGLAMPSAMDAALGALSAERSGVGSALIQAVRQVGGTFGVAILGAILNSTYRNGLNVVGLPPAAAEAARSSVSAGVAVAHQLGATALLDSARSAFVSGMDTMLLICAGIALVGTLLALVFLPRRASEIDEQGAEAVKSGHEIVVG